MAHNRCETIPEFEREQMEVFSKEIISLIEKFKKTSIESS